MAKTEISRPSTANIPPFGLRLQPELKDRIEMAAKEAGRSMNAQIAYMLQSYFNRLDDEVDQLGAALEKEKQESISFGLNNGIDRAAVLKVLLLQEVSLLKRRVDRLGGRHRVLKTDKSELVKQIGGPLIHGTDHERKSYFSQVVENMPVTALLTTQELERLAERVVTLQTEQERAKLAVKTKVKG